MIDKFIFLFLLWIWVTSASAVYYKTEESSKDTKWYIKLFTIGILLLNWHGLIIQNYIDHHELIDDDKE